LCCKEDESVSTTYAVISLNYDRVLESICDVTTRHPFDEKRAVSFDIAPGSSSVVGAPRMVKLHGSIDNAILAPPTWQKALHVELRPLWKEAYALLKQANHLRIIGYSLPQTDGYVPYLLKAGLRHAPNLKSIHVLCLDANGEVEKRFNDLIDFRNYRFANENVLYYLSHVADQVGKDQSLELAHWTFFERFRG
jgi:hypothetical protein